MDGSSNSNYTLAIIYSQQSALKYVDSCCVLSADVRRDCVRRFESQTHNLYMLTPNSSTFFVADMVIPFGRYGLFVWPMWSWPIWFVADMICGRYGTDTWSSPRHSMTLLAACEIENPFTQSKHVLINSVNRLYITVSTSIHSRLFQVTHSVIKL